jgi:hypothetical protein
MDTRLPAMPKGLLDQLRAARVDPHARHMAASSVVTVSDENRSNASAASRARRLVSENRFVATWARRLTAIPNGLLHQQLSGIFCSARGHAARAASCRCPRRTGAARESASRARRLSLTRATCVPTWARRRNGDGERLLWSAPRAARLAPHAGQVAASSVMTGSDENRRCTSAASRPRRFRWRGPGSCPRGHAD